MANFIFDKIGHPIRTLLQNFVKIRNKIPKFCRILQKAGPTLDTELFKAAQADPSSI